MPPDVAERALPLRHAAKETGILSTYPGGMEGWDWADIRVAYIPSWSTCPLTVTYPSSSRLIAIRQGVEPTT